MTVITDQYIEEGGRWAAQLLARDGLIARAHRISPDDPRVVFEAHRTDSDSPKYEHAYPLFVLERDGPRAMAEDFVKSARTQFAVRFC